ncbi:MAG: glycosyltransferase family 39 protein [Acidobacteria bacterium]|nr:glycosyltransferase family 39 protein [Acidobacteriota bacterium]
MNNTPILERCLRWTPLAACGAALFWLVWSLQRHRLLEQPIWSGDGFLRMCEFALGYAIAAALVWGVWRRALAPLICGAAVLLTAASVGLEPLAAVALMAVSAVALGDWICRRCGLRPEPALAFLAGLSAMVFCVGVSAHYAVNYRMVYLAGLLLPLVANCRCLPAYGRELASWLRPRWASSFAGFASLAATGFLVLAHLLVVLKPEVSFDGLAMHLLVPQYVAQHHQWSFDATRFAWALMPMGADWVYVVAYLLGGEFAARLANFLLLLVILAMLHGLVRRWLRPPAALLVVCLFASTPLAQLVTGSLFVENLQAALILGALVCLERLRRERRPGWLIPAALFLGTSLAVKFGSLAFVLPLAALAAGRRPRPVRTVLAAAYVLLVTALPPYAGAWHAVGNPLFPFLGDKFPSQKLPAVPFTNPFSPNFNAWNALDRLTFASHEFLESHDGALGFHYLVFLPAGVLLLTRRGWRRAGVAALTAAVASTVILKAQPNLRYLYPALPLWSLLIAHFLAAAPRRGKVASASVLVGAAGLLALNVCFLPAAGWYHRGFFLWPPWGGQAAREYEESMAPGRRLVEYLNLRHPGEPAWFVGNAQYALLEGRPYTANWHQYLFASQVKACRTAADVLELARREGLKHFVVPGDFKTSPAVRLAVRAFLSDSTEAEWQHGAFVLLRLKPEVALGADLLRSGGAAQGWPEWQRNGRVTVDPSTGQARVTVSDTLARYLPVRDDITYSYSVTAYCESDRAVLRLQINWHDAAGRMLGTTFDPRPCGPEWTVYSRPMRPPPGSRGGVVILSGHGADPVLVRSASLVP